MGKLIWVTGLSGSGKSYFAKKFISKLNKNKIPIIHLDGDKLRKTLGPLSFGYSYEERLKLAFFYSKLCKNIISQRINVIISTISLFHKIHEWNSKNFQNYNEIYIKPNYKKITDQNKKNLYKSNKKTVGLGIKAEIPLNQSL